MKAEEKAKKAKEEKDEKQAEAAANGEVLDPENNEENNALNGSK